MARVRKESSLTPRDGEVKNFPGPWAGDGSGFYVLSDEDREFLGLAFQDATTGQKRWVETPDFIRIIIIGRPIFVGSICDGRRGRRRRTRRRVNAKRL